MAKHVGCSCQNKSIGSMKRRKIGKVSSKGLQNMVTQDLLPVTGGYLAGSLLDGVIEKISPKAAEYGRWVKIGVGALLGITQKGTIARVGLGVATNGVVELAQDAMKSGGVNLLPPGRPSYYIAGTDEPGAQYAGNGTRVVVD